MLKSFVRSHSGSEVAERQRMRRFYFGWDSSGHANSLSEGSYRLGSNNCSICFKESFVVDL